jgi:hypothetical protein
MCEPIVTRQQGHTCHPLALTNPLQSLCGAFACTPISHQLCYGSHSSFVVGHYLLDKLVPSAHHYMVDLMVEVTVLADMTRLATSVAGLCNGFE